MNKKQMEMVIETVYAYIITNEEALIDLNEAGRVKDLKELLGELQTEQRLMLRTIMCVVIDAEVIEFIDITEFIDLQNSYTSNDVDPDVLTTVAQLIYQNNDVCVIGYSSVNDTQYWMDIFTDSFNYKNPYLRVSATQKYKKYVEQNR